MFGKTLLAFALIFSVALAQSADVQKVSDEKLKSKLYTVSTVVYDEKASNDYGKKLLDLINKLPNDSYSEINAAAGTQDICTTPGISGLAGFKLVILLVRTLSYMEEAKDGKIIWKKTSDNAELNQQGTRIKDLNGGCKLSPGVRIFMTVNDAKEVNHVTVDYLLCVTVMKECKAIPGQKVRDMVIVSSQTNGSLTLELDKWSRINQQLDSITGGPWEKISMLVKVTNYKPDSTTLNESGNVICMPLDETLSRTFIRAEKPDNIFEQEISSVKFVETK